MGRQERAAAALPLCGRSPPLWTAGPSLDMLTLAELGVRNGGKDDW